MSRIAKTRRHADDELSPGRPAGPLAAPRQRPPSISLVIYVVFAFNALLVDIFRPNLNLTFSGPSNRFLDRPSHAIHTSTNARLRKTKIVLEKTCTTTSSQSSLHGNGNLPRVTMPSNFKPGPDRSFRRLTMELASQLFSTTPSTRKEHIPCAVLRLGRVHMSSLSDKLLATRTRKQLTSR